jgi:hypothetical protein
VALCVPPLLGCPPAAGPPPVAWGAGDSEVQAALSTPTANPALSDALIGLLAGVSPMYGCGPTVQNDSKVRTNWDFPPNRAEEAVDAEDISPHG